MYIVIEFDSSAKWASIVTYENGENKVFDTKKDAKKEADFCQNAIIVKTPY
jgi:hypothetical protein